MGAMDNIQNVLKFNNSKIGEISDYDWATIERIILSFCELYFNRLFAVKWCSDLYKY